MDALKTALEWAQLVEWVLLALAGLKLWRSRRDASATWLACTFASLAIVVVAGMALGSDESIEGAQMWLVKGLIAMIVLFPYFLFRFLDTIVDRRPWIWVAANTLVAVALLATAALPSFPDPDATPPWWVMAWIGVFMVEWVFLLGYVAWKLWRSGRGQPPVARRRMRTMGTGAFVLAGILAVSAFGSQGDEVTVAELVTSSLALIAGPLFLFGFAPPRLLRAQWRRKEEADLREMEVGLVKALSREEIADALLPAVVNLLGGRGAALIDAEGTVVGQRGLTSDDLDTLRVQVSIASEHYVALEVGTARIIPMETGWLVVMSGPFTPFFGTDEIQMISAAAVLADLALGRANLYELEMRAREAMRDFVAIASHDLRTPVTVIQGFSELLSNQWGSLDDEKRQDYAKAINRQALALDRLIRDLLTVSKLDVDEVDVEQQEVDILEIANQTIETVAVGIPVTVSGVECPLALADPDHVSRMLQNYVKNALIYGQPPYEITVVGSPDKVTVRVCDHGSGIPRDFETHLFEKFARVDKKKSKAVQGTGLGLSIVRGLARANGGDAWYEREAEGGVCFAFSLPRANVGVRGLELTKGTG